MRAWPYLLMCLACAGCRGREAPPAPCPSILSSEACRRTSLAAADPDVCPDELTGRDLAPGLRLERLRVEPASPVGLGDRCLVLLRADPATYELALRTANHDGGARPVPKWAADFDLVAAINASMFRPDLRSTGLTYDRERRNNDKVNAKFGSFLLFDSAEGNPPTMMGEGCPGFDLDVMRADYRAAVQNYRLLDCNGDAIPWKDEKVYSAAAIGLDRKGWIVFALMRTPYLMKTFAEILADERLTLRSAMFVEGGPEATLHVHAGATSLTFTGSYETTFTEHDDNDRAWDIPNIVGLRRH